MGFQSLLRFDGAYFSQQHVLMQVVPNFFSFLFIWEKIDGDVNPTFIMSVPVGKFSLPGFFLASAINSAKVLAGTLG